MLKHVVLAAVLLAPAAAGGTTLGPGLRGPASLIEPAQYCRCGRVCYARDYYGRCITYRCRACGHYPDPTIPPTPKR
jgi:hypothetical protein